MPRRAINAYELIRRLPSNLTAVMRRCKVPVLNRSAAWMLKHLDSPLERQVRVDAIQNAVITFGIVNRPREAMPRRLLVLYTNEDRPPMLGVLTGTGLRAILQYTERLAVRSGR